MRQRIQEAMRFRKKAENRSIERKPAGSAHPCMGFLVLVLPRKGRKYFKSRSISTVAELLSLPLKIEIVSPGMRSERKVPSNMRSTSPAPGPGVDTTECPIDRALNDPLGAEYAWLDAMEPFHINWELIWTM